MARKPASNPIPGLAWIAQQVVEFLSTHFRLPKPLFQRATNLQAAVGLDQDALHALAAPLTQLPFMQDYGARISAADLTRVKTMGDLARIIRSSLMAAGRPPAAGRKEPVREKAPAGKGTAAKKAVSLRLPLPGPPEFLLAPWSRSGCYGCSTGPIPRRPPRPPQARPSAVAARGPLPRRPPRYANPVLLEQTSGRRMDERVSLNPSQVVRLRLDIGKLSPESQVRGPTPMPEERLPADTDIDLDVMVSSSDFSVAADASALEAAPAPRIATGRFTLPADGSAATTPAGGKYLTFCLKVPDRPKRSRALHARIGYYYRNILVQSQHLTVHVGEPGGFSFITDFTVSADLTGLDKIPERPRISVLTNANADGSHQIVLRHAGKPDGADSSHATLAVDSDKIGSTIGALRKVLTARAPTTAARSRAELEEDLRQLAPIGRELYDQLPGQKEFAFFVQLFEHPEAYVVQVARPATSGFVFPWSFIYEIPLQSRVRPTLCPLVAQWDGKEPLVQGAPRQCPHGPHRSDVLCPFGFWGFRYAIEQVASGDTLGLHPWNETR